MKAEKLPLQVEVWDIEELLSTPIGDWPVGVSDGYMGNRIRKYPAFLEIRTLSGWTKGTKDFMLILLDDEFYPCKKDIFNKSYRILDNEGSTL